MSDERKFVDSNVLVYLFDTDSPGKQERAREVLREERDRIILSVQVIGEFYVTVTRKLAVPLSPDLAARAVEDFCRFQVQALHPELVKCAMRRARSSRLSYRDALIVETALDAGADVLFTEDLQNHRQMEGLQVVNPFR